MEIYLSSLGFDIRMSVVNGYPSKVSPPTGPEAKRRNGCNVETINVILNGLSGDISSQVNRCKSTKSLWGRLKKLYGNELTTAEPVCEEKMRNVTHVSVDDEGRSVSNNNNNEEVNHLFMAQESEDERHTSQSDHADQSYQQDVFGSDTEDEEGDEAEVDLEGELVSALEELSRVINEYKLFKNAAIMEQIWLIKCLEDSEKCISDLKTQQEDTKECKCKDIASNLEAKDKEYQQLEGEMENL